MAKRKNKPGAGRPFIVLTDEQLKLLDSLASIHCTNEEIAAMLDISSDTLVRNYAERIDKAKQGGRASLRRRQWIASEPGKPGAVNMLQWLGKQLLGQKERIEQTNFDGDDLLTDEQLKEKIERLLAQMDKK